MDWFSESNEILFNPRMPAALKEGLLGATALLDTLPRSHGHVSFATSGSSGSLKWVVLSKEAMLISAQAVNKHLTASSNDRWLNPLPEFHVGGAGIALRGMLSHSKVIPCVFPQARWSAEAFVAQTIDSQATLTALVPAQLYDLVAACIKAPPLLRAVIVGGGFLSEALYFAAVSLGWKLLPSYGLTECASQVATAPNGSWEWGSFPLAQPLDHVQLKADERGNLNIKSPSLLTAYLEKKGEGFALRDPKVDGWFATEDQAVFEGGALRSIRRPGNVVKVGGENVDLLRLEGILEEERLRGDIEEDVALVARPDDRLGHCIHLVVAPCVGAKVSALIDRYHQRVFPFEKIRKVHEVDEIPRSPMKKLLRGDLERLMDSR